MSENVVKTDVHSTGPKVVLYMAISSDGFIAGEHDETPWSDAEWVVFLRFIRTCDAILLGRRTYETMSRDGDFVDDVRYIVATSDESFDTGDFEKIDIKTKKDMPDVQLLGIIGGGELNARLAKLGVIDEMILDIESVTLGTGIKLFGTLDVPLKLQLLGTQTIGEATTQRHYKILNGNS